MGKETKEIEEMEIALELKKEAKRRSGRSFMAVSNPDDKCDSPSTTNNKVLIAIGQELTSINARVSALAKEQGEMNVRIENQGTSLSSIDSSMSTMVKFETERRKEEKQERKLLRENSAEDRKDNKEWKMKMRNTVYLPVVIALVGLIIAGIAKLTKMI